MKQMLVDTSLTGGCELNLHPNDDEVCIPTKYLVGTYSILDYISFF